MTISKKHKIKTDLQECDSADWIQKAQDR